MGVVGLFDYQVMELIWIGDIGVVGYVDFGVLIFGVVDGGLVIVGM